MENKLSKLYNELANAIVSMIPTEFEEVYCMGEVTNGGSGKTVVFYFKDSQTKKFVRGYDIPNIYDLPSKEYDKLQFGLFDIVGKIYDVFIEHNQEPWTMLDLYFNSQGKFKVDFSYDKIDNEKYDQVARQVIWAYEKVGYTYKEGTYPQKILDKYLKENK